MPEYILSDALTMNETKNLKAKTQTPVNAPVIMENKIQGVREFFIYVERFINTSNLV